jgi:hypothetical protein
MRQSPALSRKGDAPARTYILLATVLLLRYRRAATPQSHRSSLRPRGVRARRSTRRRIQVIRETRTTARSSALQGAH